MPPATPAREACPAPNALSLLRAAGEPTRLRILALLAEGERSVKDMTHILGQSQPRISRHLKLLAEAGLLERHREGCVGVFTASRTRARGPVAGAIGARLVPFDPMSPATASAPKPCAEARVGGSSRLFRGNMPPSGTRSARCTCPSRISRPPYSRARRTAPRPRRRSRHRHGAHARDCSRRALKAASASIFARHA